MAFMTHRPGEVGRDKFPILNQIHRPRPMAQEAKDQHIPQHPPEAVRDTGAPCHDNVIDSKMAARKYGGVVIKETHKSKIPGTKSNKNVIDSKQAAKRCNGVLVTEYKEKK